MTIISGLNRKCVGNRKSSRNLFLTDTGENEPKCAVYYRPGAESYSSFGLLNYFFVMKRSKKRGGAVHTLAQFRLWTSFESLPMSVKARFFRLPPNTTSKIR